MSEQQSNPNGPITLSVIGALLFCLTAIPVQSSQVAYEGFDYVSASLESQSGGSGWGLNWSSNIYVSPISSSSLGYGALATSGGSVTFGPASVTTVYTRQLASTFGASAVGGTLWMSLLYLNTAGSTAAEARIGFYGNMTADASGLNTATASGGLPHPVDVGRPATGGSADEISLYSGSTIFSTGIATPRGAEAAFLLMRFTLTGDANPDTVSLWVNPNISLGEGSLGAAQATFTSGTSDMDVVNGLRFQTPNTGGFSIDEIRVGTTFADVTPVVPEPTTLIMVGLGIGAVALQIRRRK